MHEGPFQEVVMNGARDDRGRNGELRDVGECFPHSLDDLRICDEREEQAIDDGTDRIGLHDISHTSKGLEHPLRRVQHISMSNHLGPQRPVDIGNLLPVPWIGAGSRFPERMRDLAGQPSDLEVKPGIAPDERVVKIERDRWSHRAPSRVRVGYGTAQSAANRDRESSASRSNSGSLIAAKNASTMCESNWVPLFLRISATAASNVSAFRYGRSVVMASSESATAMIRAPSGIRSPMSRDGYPPPSHRSW